MICLLGDLAASYLLQASSHSETVAGSEKSYNDFSWRSRIVANCTGFENQSLYRLRGFESHLLRLRSPKRATADKVRCDSEGEVKLAQSDKMWL